MQHTGLNLNDPWMTLKNPEWKSSKHLETTSQVSTLKLSAKLVKHLSLSSGNTLDISLYLFRHYLFDYLDCPGSQVHLCCPRWTPTLCSARRVWLHPIYRTLCGMPGQLSGSVPLPAIEGQQMWCGEEGQMKSMDNESTLQVHFFALTNSNQHGHYFWKIPPLQVSQRNLRKYKQLSYGIPHM